MFNEILKVGICDDDPAQRQLLDDMLKKCDRPVEIEMFADAEHILESFYAGKYDLILMDIYMGGISGIDAAEKIRQADPDVPFAFITTSPDHALESYRFRVNRYLLKPLREADVMETVHYALREKKLQPGITIRIGGKEVLLPYRQIRYIEQSGRSLIIYMTGGEKAETIGKLDDLEQLVAQPPFLRCHKSFLVNMNFVQTLDTDLNIFEMSEGGNVYIRRSSVSKANSIYRAFMFEQARRHS